MTSIVFTQFLDNLPVDINKAYYVNDYQTDTGFQEIHKLCLFPEKLREYLQINQDYNIINATITSGITPLYLALRNNVEESIKLLLEYGADINIINKYNKYTPLMIAYCYCDIKYVKLLLEYSIDSNSYMRIENMYGFSVIHIVCEKYRAKLLIQYITQHDTTYGSYYIKNSLNTIYTILSNINNSINLEIDINLKLKQLKRLTQFDYNSILLFELKKCI